MIQQVCKWLTSMLQDLVSPSVQEDYQFDKNWVTDFPGISPSSKGKYLGKMDLVSIFIAVEIKKTCRFYKGDLHTRYTPCSSDNFTISHGGRNDVIRL